MRDYLPTPTPEIFRDMQTDFRAALRRPWFVATRKFLQWEDGAALINREWFVPVFDDFDSDTTWFALRPIAPFVWLARFWEMNRWCLERALVRRIFDLAEGERYASRTLRPIRRWSLRRTDDRTGRVRGLRLARSFLFWP